MSAMRQGRLFDVTLVNTDGKTHYSYLEQHGDFDVARAGWIADYKDPENFLALCKTGTGNNYSQYSNPDYDALLAKAAAEADQPARMRLLADAEAIGVKRWIIGMGGAERQIGRSEVMNRHLRAAGDSRCMRGVGL